MKTRPKKNPASRRDSPKIGGIIPAIASPCDRNDTFLEDEFAALASRLYAESVDGLYVCGATGDGYNMLPAERKRAAEIASDIGRKHGKCTIIHVGTNSSRQSAELAEHAAKVGANVISSMPPPNRNVGQLVTFYRDLHSASGLPVLVYHIPALTGRSFTLDELLRLVEAEGAIGAKFTDWNLFLLKRIMAHARGSVVFSGYDELLCPGLLYGASGGIGSNYNMLPGLFVAIERSVRGGDIDSAMKLQNSFIHYVEPIWEFGFGPAFEAVMQELGLATRVWRAPRDEFDRKTRARFLSVWRPRFEATRALAAKVLSK